MIEQRIATPVQVTPMHLDAFLNFRPCLEMFDAVLDFEIRGNGQRRTNDVHVKRNTCVAWREVARNQHLLDVSNGVAEQEDGGGTAGVSFP